MKSLIMPKSVISFQTLYLRLQQIMGDIFLPNLYVSSLYITTWVIHRKDDVFLGNTTL